MAAELKNALDQLETDVASLANVQRAQLGQLMNAAAEATESKCVACVYMVSGSPDNDTFTATTERHRVEVAFYWPLNAHNVELVEQNVATMWDVAMTKFFGSDADRNLTEKATLAMVAGEDGNEPYNAGYVEIGGKLHRVLTIPVQVVLNTHSV